MLSNSMWAFPTVAIVRKGQAKQKGKDRNGKDILVVGPDLKDRLRIAWKPGTQIAQERWRKTEGYGDSFIVNEIRAMIPSEKAWDCLEIYNEAHQAGRMVMRATDTQVLTLRDAAGKYIVRNGEPYMPYIPGEDITYERDGRRITLPVKPSIRLRLFLYELGLPCQFELRSTSYYDSVNLRQQFAGIQAMANMLNRGYAGGIPFTIYRQQQEVTWNKADGSAVRVPHWILNVMVGEDWLKAATARMSKNALQGWNIAALLEPVNNIAGNQDPTLADEEDEEEDAGSMVLEHNPDQTMVGAAINLGGKITLEEEQPTTPPPPEEPPHPAEEEGKATTTPPTAAQPEARTPLPPYQVKDRLLDKASYWKTQPELTLSQARAQRVLMQRILEDELDGLAIHNQENPTMAANTLLFWITGFRDFHHVEIEYVRALKTWLRPKMADGRQDGYTIDEAAAQELRACYIEATGLPLDLINGGTHQ